MSAKCILWEREGVKMITFRCPGCDMHILPISGAHAGPQWQFTGTEESPTLSPSILCRHGRDGKEVCHSFVRSGRIEFCGDSTHSLAGKTVDLSDVDDNLMLYAK